MTISRSWPPFALAFFFSLATIPACSKSSTDEAPVVPASSDPAGKDLVKGAVVAAAESAGGIRLYKIIFVDEFPPPMGTEYHLIVYDPKVATFEEAAKLWKQGSMKVLVAHIEVRQVHFLPRDHRVIAVEPLTKAEMEPYLKANNNSE